MQVNYSVNYEEPYKYIAIIIIFEGPGIMKRTRLEIINEAL